MASTRNSHRRAISLPWMAIELGDEVEPPSLDGAHHVFRPEAFDDLRPGQPVSQALTQRIAHDCACLEKRGHDVCARQEKHGISTDGTAPPTGAPRLQIDHDETAGELSD